MSSGLVGTCLVVAAAGCGGRTHSTGDTSEASGPPTLEESVLAQGIDLRFEAISGDGALIAYSAVAEWGAAGAVGAAGMADVSGRDVWVVSTAGGEPQSIGSVRDLDSARFDGTTLLVFRGDGVADGSIGESCAGKACGPAPETWAPELFAWRPNDAALTSLATDVDPGSVHFSRNGRWISLEANDPPLPASPPDILLVDTIDLSVRRLGAMDRARARFARQSDWILFGGRGPFLPAPDLAVPGANECNGNLVARLSLLDGRVLPITCYSSRVRSRWEPSPDGNWLVHGLQSENENVLARTPIEGGVPEVLATGLDNADSGKSFDVFGGARPQVVFIKRDPTSGVRALSVVPLESDGAERVITEGCVDTGSGTRMDVDGIGDHHDGTLSFRCREELHAVPAKGGTPVSLGARAAVVVDELDQRLLALDGDGTLRLFRGSTGRVEIPDSATNVAVTAARFVGRDRILASTGPRDPPWTLMLFGARGSSYSLGEITGPFGVDPQVRGFFVTTRQIDGKSRLVRVGLLE